MTLNTDFKCVFPKNAEVKHAKKKKKKRKLGAVKDELKNDNSLYYIDSFPALNVKDTLLVYLWNNTFKLPQC